MEQNQNNYTMQEDEIDLRELFLTLKRNRKIILAITLLVTLCTAIYVFLATPWYQAKATIEISKYRDAKTTEIMDLEKGEEVAKRLNVRYIDIYKYAGGRDSKIKTISIDKKNKQFVTITALAKSNSLAVSEIESLASDLEARHKISIDRIIRQKKEQLEEIDRKIFQLKDIQISRIQEQIDIIQKAQIPAIDKELEHIKANIKNTTKQKESATTNLSSLYGDKSLAAIRLTEIQGYNYQISTDKLQLVMLESQKQKLSSGEIPQLYSYMEKLRTIDLAQLEEERKEIESFADESNFQNTKIVGEIITQDQPIKPKKKLIVVVGFITGFILSIFIVFFMEFLKGFKEEDESRESVVE